MDGDGDVGGGVGERVECEGVEEVEFGWGGGGWGYFGGGGVEEEVGGLKSEWYWDWG